MAGLMPPLGHPTTVAAWMRILVLFLSTLEVSTSCEQVHVEGSKSFPELMGTYSQEDINLPAKVEVTNRPVYRLIRSDNQGFMFHVNGAWYVGTNSTVWEAVCAIAVLDEADYPEQVEHVWQEMGPYTGTWHPEPSIRVSCAVPGNMDSPAPLSDPSPTTATVSSDPVAIYALHQALEERAGEVPASPSAYDGQDEDHMDDEDRDEDGYGKRGTQECAGMWIRGSAIHAELMGVYRRTERLEDGRPVFRRRGSTGLLELAYYDQTPRGFWGIARGDDEYLPLHKLDSTGSLAGLTASVTGDDGERGDVTSSAWLEYSVAKKLLLPNDRITTVCVSSAELAATEAAEREAAAAAAAAAAASRKGERDGTGSSRCKEQTCPARGVVPFGIGGKSWVEAMGEDGDRCDMCTVFGNRYGGYATFDEFLETHAPSLFNSGSMEDLLAFSEVMGEVSAPVVKLVMLGFDTGLWRRSLNISREELVAGYVFSWVQLEEVGQMSWELGVRQEHAVELLDVALEPLPVLQESWAPVLALIALEQLDYFALAPDLLLLDLNDVDIRGCVIRMLSALDRDVLEPIRWFAIDNAHLEPSLLQLIEDIGRRRSDDSLTFEHCILVLLDIMTAITTDLVPATLAHLLRLHGVDARVVLAVFHAAEVAEIGRYNVDAAVLNCAPPVRPLSSETLAAARQAVAHNRSLAAALSALARGGCLRSDDGFYDGVSLNLAAGVVVVLVIFTWAFGRSKSPKRRKKHHVPRVAAAAAAASAGSGGRGSLFNSMLKVGKWIELLVGDNEEEMRRRKAEPRVFAIMYQFTGAPPAPCKANDERTLGILLLQWLHFALIWAFSLHYIVSLCGLHPDGHKWVLPFWNVRLDAQRYLWIAASAIFVWTVSIPAWYAWQRSSMTARYHRCDDPWAVLFCAKLMLAVNVVLVVGAGATNVVSAVFGLWDGALEEDMVQKKWWIIVRCLLRYPLMGNIISLAFLDCMIRTKKPLGKTATTRETVSAEAGTKAGKGKGSKHASNGENKDPRREHRRKEEAERRKKREERRKLEKQRRKEEARQKEEERRRILEKREADRAARKLEEEAELQRELEEERAREALYQSRREEDMRRREQRRREAQREKAREREKAKEEAKRKEKLQRQKEQRALDNDAVASASSSVPTNNRSRDNIGRRSRGKRAKYGKSKPGHWSSPSHQGSQPASSSRPASVGRGKRTPPEPNHSATDARTPTRPTSRPAKRGTPVTGVAEVNGNPSHPRRTKGWGSADNVQPRQSLWGGGSQTTPPTYTLTPPVPIDAGGSMAPVFQESVFRRNGMSPSIEGSLPTAKVPGTGIFPALSLGASSTGGATSLIARRSAASGSSNARGAMGKPEWPRVPKKAVKFESGDELKNPAKGRGGGTEGSKNKVGDDASDGQWLENWKRRAEQRRRMKTVHPPGTDVSGARNSSMPIHQLMRLPLSDLEPIFAAAVDNDLGK